VPTLSAISHRLIRWVLVAVVFSAIPAGLDAQRGSGERVLVLPPVPLNGTDPAAAVEFADQLRDRMDGKFGLRLRIIPSETICEALEASGFDCSTIIPPENANALARFLQATGYVVGWISQSDSVRLQLRMVDAAGSGLAGWATFAAAADRDLGAFARDVSNGLEDHVRGAQYARECNQRRERSDFDGARDRARRAYERVPDHPTASMCLALVHESEQHADSIIGALESAVRGDSLNNRAWQMLGRRYLSAGDTAAGVNAFIMQLNADPNNMELRHAMAGARMQEGRYADALDLLQYALDRNPLDVPTLQLKARACVDGELWACALEALSAEYEVDSSLIGDTVFYAKVFGASQALSDTANMLRWSQEGVEQVPTSVALWRARAAALKEASQREEALEAYAKILELDSTAVFSALAAVQLLLDSTLVIDSMVPVDTARLAVADTLLQLVVSQRSDTATLMNVAAMYFNPGARLVQQRIRYPIASAWLQHAVDYDLRGQISTQASFFLGLALFFQIADLDLLVREAEDCDMVDVEIEMIQRAKEAMTIGSEISPDAASQILGYITQYEGTVLTYKPVFGCQ